MKKQGKKDGEKGLVNLIKREIDRQKVDAYTKLTLAPIGESPVAQQNFYMLRWQNWHMQRT